MTQNPAPPPPVILIVELEGSLSSILATRLVPLGYLVVAASTAQTASSTLATYPIVLAIVNHLAGSVQQDNHQLIQFLKQRGVPVIAVSTVRSSLDAIAGEVDATLLKPYPFATLLAEVRKLLP